MPATTPVTDAAPVATALATPTSIAPTPSSTTTVPPADDAPSVWAPTALPDGWGVLDATTVVRLEIATRRVQRFVLPDGAVLDLQVLPADGNSVGLIGGTIHGQPAVVARGGGADQTLAWWIESGWMVTTYLQDAPGHALSELAVAAVLDGLAWRDGGPTVGIDPASLPAGSTTVIDAPVAAQATETSWRIRAADGAVVTLTLGPLDRSPDGTEAVEVPGVGTRWTSMAILSDGSMARLSLADQPFSSATEAQAGAVLSALRGLPAREAAAWLDERRLALADWPVAATVDVDPSLQAIVRRPDDGGVWQDGESSFTATTEAICLVVRSTGEQTCRVVITTTGPDGWVPQPAKASFVLGGTWYVVALPTVDTAASIDVCAASADGQPDGVLPSTRIAVDDQRDLVVAAIPSADERMRWCTVDDDGTVEAAASSMRERPAGDSLG